MPLLNLLEGKVSLIDLISLLIPYLLIFILALVSIGIWISICCCCGNPKCLLKRTNNKDQDRKTFICLMVFSGFCLVIVVLGITILVYISNGETDFNGSICSLLMFQYEIVNGQGLLGKKQIYKPYWYGSNGISNAITEIKTTLEELQSKCNDYKTDFDDASEDLIEQSEDLITDLIDLYEKNKDKSIQVIDPDDYDSSKKINIKPDYIINLGPYDDNKTYIGKIYEEFQNNYRKILEEIIIPVTALCNTIGDVNDLLDKLDKVESTIEDLNKMLDNLSKIITDYIVSYKSYIISFGYKINFALFIILTGGLIIEFIFFYLYFFRPFSIIKCNIYFFLHLINFVLIICIIYNAIFGIFSLIMANLADIIDAVLSKENLSSENPRLIPGNDNIQKLARCLRGDGDLFDSFVDEDIKKVIEPLTQLYIYYTPIKTINENIGKNEKNKYNTLLSLEEIISNLNKMKEDYILTTTFKNAGIYDINRMFQYLSTYTNANKGKQERCDSKAYHVWTTINDRCPNINENEVLLCKLLQGENSPPPSDYGVKAENIMGNYYAINCPVDSSTKTLKQIIKGYIMTLLNYFYENKDLISSLLDSDTSSTSPSVFNGFFKIKNNFEINNLKTMIEEIDEDISSGFYNTFKNLLNDTTKNTYELKNTDFNLFSWMNCTNIGQNYNVTLSTIKTNLSNELYVITYCSLFFEIFFIAELYIMLGLIKNLKDEETIEKKEKKKNKVHHSIEELQTYEVKETKTNDDLNIFSLKSKKKYEEYNLLKLKRKNKQTENNKNKKSE